MRSPYRIEPFLKVLDLDRFVLLPTEVSEDNNLEDLGLTTVSLKTNIVSKMDEIKSQWFDHPDYRFTQLLYNMGIGGQYFSIIYHKEEPDILMMCGRSRNESYGWISYFDKEGNTREEPVFRFICELDTEHLATMIHEAENMKRKYSAPYLKMFEDELRSRDYPGPYLSEEGWGKQAMLTFLI